MLDFLRHRWFLLSLLLILAVGMTWPRAMEVVASRLPGDAIVAVVTFSMAIALDTKSLWGAVRRPGPAWLAVALNSALAPLLGWLMSRPLPSELALGVIVATSVPCTLATAAVWTRRAGGNDAVAFLVTMITNLMCFMVVPGWIKLLTGVEAVVDYWAITIGLIVVVVLPILLGQLLRSWKRIGLWATHHKEGLSLFAQVGVLSMVFLGAVGSGLKLEEIEDDTLLTTGNVALLLVAVSVVHGALLGAGLGLGHILRISREDSIAMAFAGSQKTLMVGAFLASAVGPLAILPMVAYHAVQLFVDTLVADWFRDRSRVIDDRRKVPPRGTSA